MGMIAQRWAVAEEVRDKPDWLHDDDAMLGGAITAAGVRVTREAAMKLSTVWGCVRLLTNTVSTLPADIVVKLGSTRFRLDRRDEIPSWLRNPNPADPAGTWTEHISQVVASLLLDGNFFVYVPGGVYNPLVLLVLDPRLVDVRQGPDMAPLYDLKNAAGVVTKTVDGQEMLHGTWVRMPGALRGMSPIEAARQGIGLGIAAEDHGARFFGQGASLSFGVEVPGTLTPEQREELGKNLKKRYAGLNNSHAIGVLTGGAKFISGLSITNEQAQFVATLKWEMEDIAGRIFGIPPHKMGSQEPGASSYNSIEQRNFDFRQDAVLPIAARIEGQYNRLIEVPDRLRSANASAALKLNLDVILRADFASRMAGYKSGVDSGVFRPNEARALEDLPPVEGGEDTYMQSQMAPVRLLAGGAGLSSQPTTAA